jgi:spermidine synthase
MPSPRRLTAPFLLASATFSILALELALIRWMSQQIRVFAYLSNVLLMAAFLGMGLGVGLGKRFPRLVDAALPVLLCLSIVLCFAQQLGLTYISFPDASTALWGADGLKADERFAQNVTLILALFLGMAAVFVCAGSAVGDLFTRMRALDAYSIDLGGSFAGVLAVTLLSALHTPPSAWLLAGALPMLWLSRRWWTWVSLPGIVLFAWLSIGGARFSPYYRIDLRPSPPGGIAAYTLDVNRDHHQHIIDFSDAHLADPRLSAAQREELRRAREVYDLPYRFARGHRRALIVGSGTGNDVASALRSGFSQVVAVEIDPVVLQIGRALHPQRPYSDPRVVAVNNDARNYFERSGNEQFDVVCFGLLDSHTMFSSMSTLRLDNYVYTVEALRAAWKHVAPGGVMTIMFGVFHTPFIADRIMANLREATGERPVALAFAGGATQTFILAKGFDVLPSVAGGTTASKPIRPSTDDWPFLYIRPGVFPSGYLAVLACIAVVAVIGAGAVFGRTLFTAVRFDAAMFLLGAGFLLVETRGVTDLSLLFGSTWIVNAAVFGGVLAIAWIANLFIKRLAVRTTIWFFVPLFGALAASFFIRPAMLLSMPMLADGATGALMNALPIGFAGLLFSSLLAASRDPAGALGSNLLGAIAGGIVEYASVVAGLRMLTLVAIAIYAAALLVVRLRVSRAAA